MDTQRLKQIIEGALMVSDKPLGVTHLIALFEQGDQEGPTGDEVRNALSELQEECRGRGIELTEVASGYRFQARADIAPWINRLWEEKKPRYSRALLETLAIIAYRQPITRSEIEDIRGVAVSTGIIRTLLEREWVKVVGHRDVPGRPAVYATTKGFLDYFDLKNLSDLPSLMELKDIEDLNGDLFADQDLDPAADIEASQACVDMTAIEEDDDQAEEVAGERADEVPASDIAVEASPGIVAPGYGACSE